MADRYSTAFTVALSLALALVASVVPTSAQTTEYQELVVWADGYYKHPVTGRGLIPSIIEQADASGWELVDIVERRTPDIPDRLVFVFRAPMGSRFQRLPPTIAPTTREADDHFLFGTPYPARYVTPESVVGYIIPPTRAAAAPAKASTLPAPSTPSVCQTPSPVGGWVCVQGGWVPPNHPLAGGRR